MGTNRRRLLGLPEEETEEERQERLRIVYRISAEQVVKRYFEARGEGNEKSSEGGTSSAAQIEERG